MNRKNMPIIILLLTLIITLILFFYAKKSTDITVDFHKGNYIGSKECKDCHEERYDSWAKTFHKTMTQEATSSSVAGRFDGSKQTYWGITIRPIKINNLYYFEYLNPETEEILYTLQIKRTVGSRRYQQYLAQTDNTQGNYYRLELLWHIEDNRWVHLNGAFLGGDHQSFDNHTAIWNQNCIFCHSTGIQPNMTNYDKIIQSTKQGKPLNLRIDSRFESHVTDLGIACEACHANGDKHSKLNQNPIIKYYLHLTDKDDKSIVNPSKLSAKRSMDICGQCHGQRTPKTYELAKIWMDIGPTYRPGDDLQEHVNPVWKKSLINSESSDIFKQRFWNDGTPRLTAYEYQGVLQSQCHIAGNLTCNDCHSMHEGNPKGMIKEDKLTNKACYKCHEDYAKNLTQHTAHSENSEGSLCYNCHMPKITYGIMTVHRSHKIESPNPIEEFSHDKPNACVSCHIDKSSDWVKKKSSSIWPQITDKKPIKTKETLQSLLSLHSGDPVERAIAAVNISYKGDLYKAQDKAIFIPHLLYSMSENYPAIRRFSYKTLMSIINQLTKESTSFIPIQQSLQYFDFITDLNSRTIQLDKVWAIYNNMDKSNWEAPPTGSLLNQSYQLDLKALKLLRNISLQENKVINIGE
jgi:predicted CXXCH cytochrome family protein